jgi:hypothetical protein
MYDLPPCISISIPFGEKKCLLLLPTCNHARKVGAKDDGKEEVHKTSWENSPISARKVQKFNASRK